MRVVRHFLGGYPVSRQLVAVSANAKAWKAVKKSQISATAQNRRPDFGTGIDSLSRFCTCASGHCTHLRAFKEDIHRVIFYTHLQCCVRSSVQQKYQMGNFSQGVAWLSAFIFDPYAQKINYSERKKEKPPLRHCILAYC